MAKGRMISRSLFTSSKKFDRLRYVGDFDFVRLLYIALVVNADDFGREPGDAFTVTNAVFPVSRRSEDEVEKALYYLDNAHLIHRYAVDGKEFLQVVDFEEHQQGLHKRTASKCPEPPPNSPGSGRDTPGNSGEHSETDGSENIEQKELSGGSGKFPLNLTGTGTRTRREEERREDLDQQQQEYQPRARGRAAAAPLLTRRNFRFVHEGRVPVWDWQHRDFKMRLGGDTQANDDALYAFYGRVEDRWESENYHPTAEPKIEWLREFQREFGSATTSTAKTAGNESVVKRFIERG